VDVLISFFSTDFPLPKALAYTQIPNRPPPISINSLAMQSLLWDRRLVLAILDHIGVPTPRRAEVSRDGGPRVPRQLRRRVRKDLGLELPGHKAKDEDQWGELLVPDRWKGKMKKEIVPRAREVILREDGDAIIIDGKVVEKPFVEKPVDGEDHNVYIYYRGGGGRRLFRKVCRTRDDALISAGWQQVERVRPEPVPPTNYRLLHLRGIHQCREWCLAYFVTVIGSSLKHDVSRRY
jgi:hypothetical protein